MDVDWDRKSQTKQLAKAGEADIIVSTSRNLPGLKSSDVQLGPGLGLSMVLGLPG